MLKIEISNVVDQNQESLIYFDLSNGAITGNNGSTSLVLEGNATIEEYQAVLRSITYLYSSYNPNVLPRVIDCSGYDTWKAESNVATSIVSIIWVDNAPFTIDSYPYSSVSLYLNTSITLNIMNFWLSYDFPLSGSSLHIVEDPSHGTIEVDYDSGSVVYSPTFLYFGLDLISYKVCDPLNLCSEANVSITVIWVNSPPIALDFVATTREDVPAIFDLTPYISDTEDSNAVIANSLILLAKSALGDFVPIFVGDSLSLDNLSNQTTTTTTTTTSTTAALSPNCPCQNGGTCIEGSGDEPSEISGDEPSEVGSGDGGCICLPGFTGTYCEIATGKKFTGMFKFYPYLHAFGEEVIPFKICDTGDKCDTANVFLNVVYYDYLPISENITLTTPEETLVTVNLLATTSHINDQPANLHVVIITEPEHGTLNISSQNLLSYLPHFNYFGQDEIVFQVCDVHGVCSYDTIVSINITWVDHVPKSTPLSAEILEDNSVTFFLFGNVSDVDDTLYPSSINITSNVQNGDLIYNSGTDGWATYVPNLHWFGLDTFVYMVCDPHGKCNSSTVSINVLSVNHAPTAQPIYIALLENELVSQSLDGVISDIEDATPLLLVSILNNPLYGSAIMDNKHTFTYTPNIYYNGKDIFSYRVCDMQGLCNTADVFVTVTFVNQAPVLANLSDYTFENTPYLLPIREIASDVDNTADELTGFLYTTKSDSGVLTMDLRHYIVTYTPNHHYHGPVTIFFGVCDPFGLCANATLSLSVIGVNNAPIAQNLSASITVGESYTFDVMSTVFDEDNLPPIDPPYVVDPTKGLSIVTAPSGNIAQVIRNAEGRLFIQYASQVADTQHGFYGENDVFSYQICDIYGACSIAYITVMVNLPGPSIVSVVASNPSNTGFEFGVNVTIAITFSEETNAPFGVGVAISNSEVDSLFSLPQGIVDSSSYSGIWVTPSLFVVTIDECSACRCFTCSPPVLVSSIPVEISSIFLPQYSDQRVSILETSGIKNAPGKSLTSTSVAPPFSGNWGEAQPQVLQIVFDMSHADTSVAESGRLFPKGTRFTITFNGPVNIPSCNVVSNDILNSMFTLNGQLGIVQGQFITPTSNCTSIDLISRRSAPATNYATQILVIILNSASQTIASVAQLLSLFLINPSAITSGLLNNYLNSANGNSAPVIPISDLANAVTQASTQPGPYIAQLIAYDPDNRNADYGKGDVISVYFDLNTTAPDASTKAQIDAIFSFEQSGVAASLGANYIGVWINTAQLDIHIIDATGATPPAIGYFAMRLRANSIHLAIDNTSIPSLRLSPTVTGTWGEPTKLGSVYYVLPITLFLFVVLIGLLLHYRSDRTDYSKRKISRVSFTDSKEQPW